METPTAGRDVKDWIRSSVDQQRYRELHWDGSFWDYLRLVEQNPSFLRNAFQRVYDMINFHGVDERQEGSEKIIHYRFFDDPIGQGEDALYGLDKQLNNLVGILKSGAFGYGTERRILLLHGPVVSAKSTIARMLKKGLEYYSRRPEGAVYTFYWKLEEESADSIPCPMHEEPLRLLPREAREKLLKDLNKKFKAGYRLEVEG